MVDEDVNEAPHKMHIWQIVSSNTFFSKTIHKCSVSIFMVNSFRGFREDGGGPTVSRHTGSTCSKSGPATILKKKKTKFHIPNPWKKNLILTI